MHPCSSRFLYPKNAVVVKLFSILLLPTKKAARLSGFKVNNLVMIQKTPPSSAAILLRQKEMRPTTIPSASATLGT